MKRIVRLSSPYFHPFLGASEIVQLPNSVRNRALLERSLFLKMSVITGEEMPRVPAVVGFPLQLIPSNEYLGILSFFAGCCSFWAEWGIDERSAMEPW